MHRKLIFLTLVIVTSGPVLSQERPLSERLAEFIPERFPRIHFGGFPEQSQLLSHYLWYHFHHRLGNGVTLFNKEYLLTSDIWMGHARPRGSQKTIQEIHRQNLLRIEMDDEGYVQTHQHFSHAHDHGWPFPMWTQSDRHPQGVRGKTVGWHFQESPDKVPGWVGNSLKAWQIGDYVGLKAARQWECKGVTSRGIVNSRWQLKAEGINPSITTPEGVTIEAFQAPYLQLRWKQTGFPDHQGLPYIEWKRDQDTEFSPERRVTFRPEHTPLSRGLNHSIMTMYRHPLWEGKIKRIRIILAPGRSEETFEIDSFFTVYDTRHSINNPIYILACARYFAWTGDLSFLDQVINKMRLALCYQQTVMGGLKFHHIRNPWPGHGGRPGFRRTEDGDKILYGGRGIGNNYWDLMPFGWDDLYATNQYYAATLVMADIETALRDRPGWDLPLGALAFDPNALRAHARKVKERANDLFWNSDTGRFYASIDRDGNRYDYGYTFLNLDAIWYGLANDKHAGQIMDWIIGKRIVPTDTSQGPDLYHWRFGPRATTLRNIDWYGQGWHGPESIPWGGQIQDGGAVLGFSFYDLWARLQVLGADNAWQRLVEILAWEKDVHMAGGYRKYYEGGQRGTTLQGGGTAGGLGIDYEFFESSLIPSIVVYGFMGIKAQANGRLFIHPNRPQACESIRLENMLYRHNHMDVTVTNNTIAISVKNRPIDPIAVGFNRPYRLGDNNIPKKNFRLGKKGMYLFSR